MKCCSTNQLDKNIIESLSACQDENGYISNEDIMNISKEYNISEAELYGVVTFYKQFSLTKKAKYSIVVCTGTACFVMGSGTIISALENELKIKCGEMTSNGKFSLSQARCFGCCALAPLMVINGKVYGKLDASKAVSIIRGLE